MYRNKLNYISEANFLRGNKSYQNEDVHVLSNKINSYRHLAKHRPWANIVYNSTNKTVWSPRDNVFTERYEQNISM